MQLKRKTTFIFLMIMALQLYGQEDTVHVFKNQIESLVDQLEQDSIDSINSGEGIDTFIETEKSINIQRTMPPSPTAASLGFYGEHPVSLATGTPEISIPIYEIKSRKLNLPISLSYHASGIKVDQYASWVGLGWSLNAGGVITRAVAGFPDEDYNGYFMWEDYLENRDGLCYSRLDTNLTDYYFLDNVADEFYDTQPDEFFYNISGDAGKFVISQDIARIMPYKPVKIKYHLQNDSNRFTILSPDGTIYRFGVSLENINVYETTKRFVQGSSPKYSVSAWYLTEIISPDLSDTIFFKYITHTVRYGGTMRQSLKYFHSFNLDYGVSQSDLSHQEGVQPVEVDTVESALIIDNVQKLSEIRFSNGIVKIYSTDGRVDLEGGRKLDSLKIYSKNDTVNAVKSYKFNYSYFDAYVYGTWEYNLGAKKKKRLKLDSLTEKGKPPYVFEYSSVQLPPIYSCRQDFWGYFNDERSNENLIPRTTFLYQELGGANRTPNPNTITAGMLEFIQYPTEGYSKFIYEAHEYLDLLSSNQTSGGVRIKEIRKNDGLTDYEQIMKYEYKKPGLNNSSGRLISPINYSYDLLFQEGTYGGVLGAPCAVSYYKARVFFPDSFVDLGTSGGSPVAYSCVTIKDYSSENNNGKVVYKFNNEPDIIYYGNESSCFFENNPLAFRESNEWRRGKLLEEIYYDISGKIKKRNVNCYTITSNYLSKEICGLKVGTRTNYLGCNPFTDTYYNDHYNYLFYEMYNRWMYLNSSATYEYDQHADSAFVTVHTDYDYANELHAQVTKENIAVNVNDTIEKKYYYPQDYTSFPNSQALINKNIIAKPLDVRTYFNDRLVSGIQTKYNEDGEVTDFYQAEIAEETPDIPVDSTNPFTFTHKESYSYNTAKQLNQILPEDNINTAILWDYSGNYVMAKVENASYSQINSQDWKVCTYNSLTLFNSLKTLVPDAMITTYSHKPLVGMTQQTDPAGRTTYYEYDDFGRLKLVRDQNNKIISKNEYHYVTSNN